MPAFKVYPYFSAVSFMSNTSKGFNDVNLDEEELQVILFRAKMLPAVSRHSAGAITKK